MAHPYKTREGGATVTVFVPYDGSTPRGDFVFTGG